ncbi:hypothetical protein F2P56_002423 [Juglans regia]|uniref:Uncharacterized protein n=2 Tax=Juglans regia TaxID=51240 RepID=A0A833YCE4_JUGRE|nr:uncharacterized protein LOC109009057 isoform X2 [Juglans regia]KAF5481801.1 hypothetical protein F2P56_002423 [Juglans regia]
MKSVSMAKFTLQEIEALQNDGNQRAPELFDKKPGKTLADGDLINSEYLKWGNEAKELGGTLSGKLRLGCMTIWAPGLTMMHLHRGALECSTVLMEAYYSLVEQVKMATLS